MHDGSEAYLSDITRPVKTQLPKYREIEKKLQDAVYRRFLGSVPTPEEFEKITSVDDTCLYYEFLHYMGETLVKEAPVKYSEMVFETRPFQDAEQELLQLLKEWEVRGKTV